MKDNYTLCLARSDGRVLFIEPIDGDTTWPQVLEIPARVLGAIAIFEDETLWNGREYLSSWIHRKLGRTE